MKFGVDVSLPLSFVVMNLRQNVACKKPVCTCCCHFFHLMNIFKHSLLKLKHYSICLVYIYVFISTTLSQSCCHPSVILLASAFLQEYFQSGQQDGSGQDKGKLEFASQISLVLMDRAVLQRSKQSVWSVHGFYYRIQCVQLKLLIILTGGNHTMKADRMWSHLKALELSLSVVVYRFSFHTKFVWW